MILNTLALKHSILRMGREVLLTHRPNAETPSYGTADEVPLYTSNSGTEQAIVEEPRKSEIDRSGGKITEGAKKFTFHSGVGIDTGDTITLNGEYFEIVSVLEWQSRKVTFANKRPVSS